MLVCLSISAKGNRVVHKPATLTQSDLEAPVDELVKKGFLEEIFEDEENADLEAEPEEQRLKADKEAQELAAKEAEANQSKEATAPAATSEDGKKEENNVSELLQRARDKAKQKEAAKAEK